jgi:hypothetical protein
MMLEKNFEIKKADKYGGREGMEPWATIIFIIIFQLLNVYNFLVVPILCPINDLTKLNYIDHGIFPLAKIISVILIVAIILSLERTPENRRKPQNSRPTGPDCYATIIFITVNHFQS